MCDVEISITILLKKKQQNYTRDIDLPFKGLKIKQKKLIFYSREYYVYDFYKCQKILKFLHFTSICFPQQTALALVLIFFFVFAFHITQNYIF